MLEIDATETAQRLADDADNTVLLDVREVQELAIAQVAGAMHIPMGDIPARLAELDADKTIICMCHGGMRSAQVAGFLAAQGYENVINLTGGIHAWSQQVDPAVPTY
jgi:rhodanese-related sulfurtransferase